MIRRVVVATLALAAPAVAAAQGQHYVRGYTRGDGTYVQGHMQTNPDSTTLNNWSTQGNVNPYTGQPGTRPAYEPPRYGSSFQPRQQAYPEPPSPAATGGWQVYQTPDGRSVTCGPSGCF